MFSQAKGIEYYYVLGETFCQSLVTQDKHCHAHGPIVDKNFFESFLPDFMIWLSGKCPGETFTLVIDKDHGLKRSWELEQ